MFVTFAAFGHVGHIVEQFEKVQDGFVNATCLPLYSILFAGTKMPNQAKPDQT